MVAAILAAIASRFGKAVSTAAASSTAVPELQQKCFDQCLDIVDVAGAGADDDVLDCLVGVVGVVVAVVAVAVSPDYLQSQFWMLNSLRSSFQV